LRHSSAILVATISLAVASCTFEFDPQERCFEGDPCHPATLADAMGGDEDSDGIPDSLDKCPSRSNPAQRDVDGDGLGDVCDPCPLWTDCKDEFRPADVAGQWRMNRTFMGQDFIVTTETLELLTDGRFLSHVGITTESAAPTTGDWTISPSGAIWLQSDGLSIALQVDPSAQLAAGTSTGENPVMVSLVREESVSSELAVGPEDWWLVGIASPMQPTEPVSFQRSVTVDALSDLDHVTVSLDDGRSFALGGVATLAGDLAILTSRETVVACAVLVRKTLVEEALPFAIIASNHASAIRGLIPSGLTNGAPFGSVVGALPNNSASGHVQLAGGSGGTLYGQLPVRFDLPFPASLDHPRLCVRPANAGRYGLASLCPSAAINHADGCPLDQECWMTLGLMIGIGPSVPDTDFDLDGLAGPATLGPSPCTPTATDPCPCQAHEIALCDAGK
jgi:hypothetical protein